MHRISKLIHIRLRQNFILGIRDFRNAILTTTKSFSTKTQLIFFVGTGFGFYGRNAVPYKFQIFEKSFFERVILMFVLPLTIASRKRVISGGCPPSAASQKNAHIWALLNK